MDTVSPHLPRETHHLIVGGSDERSVFFFETQLQNKHILSLSFSEHPVNIFFVKSLATYFFQLFSGTVLKINKTAQKVYSYPLPNINGGLFSQGKLLVFRQSRFKSYG